MNTQRNLWPYGIILTFVLFISGTIALIVIATRNNQDLVSADYYEEEIRFQGQIDRYQRAQSLGDAVRVAYDSDRKQILVTLPADHVSGETLGRIQLYRPSSSNLDRSLVLQPDSTGVQAVDAAGLQPGLWKVKVFWSAHGADYRMDQNVVVEAHRS